MCHGRIPSIKTSRLELLTIFNRKYIDSIQRGPCSSCNKLCNNSSEAVAIIKSPLIPPQATWKKTSAEKVFHTTQKRTRWWFFTNPMWKICSSKWVHLPQISGWKETNIWSFTTHRTAKNNGNHITRHHRNLIHIVAPQVENGTVMGSWCCLDRKLLSDLFPLPKLVGSYNTIHKNHLYFCQKTIFCSKTQHFDTFCISLSLLNFTICHSQRFVLFFFVESPIWWNFSQASGTLLQVAFSGWAPPR